MKKIIPVVLLTVFVTIGGCFSPYVEAEEVKEVVESIDKPVDEPVVEYWEESPTLPLGHRETQTQVPDEIWDACVLWGGEYGIVPEFLAAIAWRETRWTNIDSADGKYKGVMQIHLASHRRRMKRLGVDDLSDVSSNVRVAADYLYELFEEYEDPTMVLAKYHGEKGDGSHSYYVKKVLELSEQLEKEHGR